MHAHQIKLHKTAYTIIIPCNNLYYMQLSKPVCEGFQVIQWQFWQSSVGDFCGTRTDGDRTFFLETGVLITANRYSDSTF